jgi:hypothetical protein
VTYPETDFPNASDHDIGGRFVHEIASPLAALRMYAQTLAELMPALVAAHDRCTDIDGLPRFPPDLRRILPETPDRLLHLANEVDDIARRYGALFALRGKIPVPQASA